MDLFDSNVWLALALSAHVHHERAREWFEATDGRRAAAFCRSTQQSLVRLLTTAAVLAPYGNRPLSNAEAWTVYGAFLADERIAMIDEEPAGLERAWARLAIVDAASPKLWMDAYLAAFAQCAGCRLVTTDAAFRRFPSLDVRVLAAP